MSAAAAAAAAAASLSNHSSSRRSSNTDNHHEYHHHHHQYYNSILSLTPPTTAAAPPRSRYELQKRRDWNAFGNYLRNHRPPVTPSRCSGAHVLEFLRHLDQQFRNTKVHNQACPFSGYQNPLSPCPCPPRQGSGSLDAIVGRLRAAFEENGGVPETNPFGAHAVRLYLREVSER